MNIPIKLPQPDEGEDSPAQWRNHVILCGINNLSIRMVEQLIKANVRVVVMDDEVDKRAERQIARMGAKIIHEDSRSVEALEQAGIYQAAAVIANDVSDLHNLEIMLLANELVEGIRVVANFFNDDDGIRQQIEGVVPNARVLSLAEIAGPAFVEASVPSTILHLLELKGEAVAIVEANVTERATIGLLFRDVTPLALAPKGNSTNWELYPPSDRVVEPGDVLTVAGKVHNVKRVPNVEFKAVDLEYAQEALKALQDNKTVAQDWQTRRRWQDVVRRIPSTVRAIFHDFDSPFRRAVLVVALITLVSTLITRVFYDGSYYKTPDGKALPFNILEAMYLTLAVVTTTGFGDYTFIYQDWGLKVFGMILMVTGAASMAVVIAYVTNYVISQKLNQALGRQKVSYMSNHVILCGIGSVGIKVLEGLVSRGQQVVVVEQNEGGRFVPQARRMGVPVIFADARLKETLRALNIEKARCIAVMTSDDLANFETALNAVKLHKDLAKDPNRKLQVVLRIFDRNLAEKLQRNFSISDVLSTSSLAAPYFIGAAFNYEIVSTFYLQKNLFVVAELVVGSGQLNELSLGELYEATKLRVLAHLPKTTTMTITTDPLEDNAFRPRQELFLRHLEPNFRLSDDFVLSEGDTVYIVGTYDQILRVRQMNS